MTTMSLEAARGLSILELLHVLNEKLSLECTKLQYPLPPVTSTASLGSEIKSLEAKAQENLRIVHHLWNLLQPVNRLPPEIISQIAQCALHDERVLNDDPSDARPIIPLTHICQYWRESIVSASENWTLVSCHHHALAALSLERSKAAPLRLAIDMSRHNPTFRDLLTPRIQNVETLWCYSVATAESLTQTLPNFPRSMPNLRSLQLGRVVDEPIWDSSTDPFEPFPNTMKSLTLYDIPLYPSFYGLGTLTKLVLHYYNVRPPLEAFLDLLEGNCSLEHADLMILFDAPLTPISHRRDVIMNRLQHLAITCWDAVVAQTMVSSIPLQKGVRLVITFYDEDTGLGLNDILSGISTTHPLNLASPTSMEYWSFPREIHLVGPNGSFLYHHEWRGHGLFQRDPFMEFPVLPLTNVRELRLVHSEPPVVFYPSSFPALETLTIERNTDLSHLFCALLNPSLSPSPSLETLEFRDCILTEEFMEELTRFASDRRNTTSAWLRRVVIGPRDGKFPTTDSIRRLGEHVPTIVDVLT